jgi:hypothetical protein
MRDDAATEARPSRRDMLKKAGVGAAIVWVSPVVSSVVTPAAAQTGPACTNYFQVKYNSANCDASLELLNDKDECLQDAELTFGQTDVCETSNIAECVSVNCLQNDGTITLSLTLPTDASNIIGAIKKADCFYVPGDGALLLINVNGSVVTFTGPLGGAGWSHVAVAFCSDLCASTLPCE